MKAMLVRYSVIGGFPVTVTASHRALDRLRKTLGFDPNIHSGMAGRGRYVCLLTQVEFDALKAQGFKLVKQT